MVKRIAVALGVNPSHCKSALDHADCEIVYMADAEAVLDELWVHDRQVVAIATVEDAHPSQSVQMLRDCLKRDWPDIEMLQIPSLPVT